MCFPGTIKAEYNKDDPSTWKHWQTAEQKSTEEGRMTNPFASDDGRYDSLSGQQWSIQTQRGGRWGSEPTKPDLSKKQKLWNLANFDVGHSGTHYGSDSAWLAMREIDHEYTLEKIRSDSRNNSLEIQQQSQGGGSGRGYSSGSRSGRGA